MKVLYGSGAVVTDILGDVMPDAEWQSLRTNAARLMEARKRSDTASILREFPFELRGGTNYFQDEFAVLYAVFSLEQYVQLEEISTSRDFGYVAGTLSEISAHHVRFVVVDLETVAVSTPVQAPSPQFTSIAVEAALSDAEQLLRSNGPASSLDRVHTAFHGYLGVLLHRAEISFDARAPLTRLFRLLRDKHPAFSDLGSRSEDLWRIVSTTASIVDAFNTLRNNASLAHPNETLIEDDEAMLAINAVRTLFHYVQSKVEP